MYLYTDLITLYLGESKKGTRTQLSMKYLQEDRQKGGKNIWSADINFLSLKKANGKDLKELCS